VINKIFKIVLICFCIIWITKELLVPGITLAILYDKYLNLTSECANAMDESWFIEQKKDTKLSQTAQVHLLVCHDYDKTRKILLSAGVSENILAYIGLEALETKQHTADQLVKQHRFMER
jgi:His-Xaa-Ser system protein (TIGR03982 family)